MCGAGRARVVLHNAIRLWPTATGLRLRNLITGGPVCGTEEKNYKYNIHID